MISMEVATKPEISYLAKLLNQITVANNESHIVEWVKDKSARAAILLEELAIPTKRDEEWRFTDLSSLLKFDFKVASPLELDMESIASLILPEADTRLVFVDGFFAPQLSSLTSLPEGVFVGNLGAANNLATKINQYLAQQQGGNDVFTTLNTAGLTDAAVVWVSRNVRCEAPIHLLFVSLAGEEPVITQPRCLIVAESGSSITLIEHYGTAEVGCPDAPNSHPYFTNAVTEIWVDDQAEVKHTRLQRDASKAFHIGKTAVSQARNSSYTCNAISLGAKLSRHNLEIYQMGEGTETTLNGLSLIGGEQLADTHSAIVLNHPHGSARQLSKCIVDHKGHAVFNGKIQVGKAAQLTDAGQLSRTLLLSPKARVDTKPQLEIIADNVKCAHGATISQLDDDEVFYLQSRGLDEMTSRHLLIDAFAAEILNYVPIESMRSMLARCVSCRTF